MPDSSSMNNSFDMFLSRKFGESSAKEWAKVSMHFEGGGPVSRAEKNMISNRLPRRGFL